MTELNSKDSSDEALGKKIVELKGPILVLGASGFVGANLFKTLLKFRKDVVGVASRLPNWRLEDVDSKFIEECNLLILENVNSLLNRTSPQTVFDCVAYGAYSFQEDSSLIYKTNFDRVVELAHNLKKRSCKYIHSGSSSEYGENSAGPLESVSLTPNSHYAVSKASVSNFLYYMGKKELFPCANLRLYSVYGPLEDSSRLIPNVVKNGLLKSHPPYAGAEISRDFIYIDDVVEAYVDAVLKIKKEFYGESYNVGFGRATTMADVAVAAQKTFGFSDAPKFATFKNRTWDVANWFANCDKIKTQLGWVARTSLTEGLQKTAAWMQSVKDLDAYEKSSKKYKLDEKYSVSAVVACYKDDQAIPIMYSRLTQVFNGLGIDYEIIFVNDCSPDNSEQLIQKLSENDGHVIGINHSRNFGSQAAFRSGMELSTKRACVLLDGDLQDPPELIADFVAKWQEGYEVIYGRRVKREATYFMQIAYKLFYYFFDKFSYIKMPRDAGDFSLIDRRVVQCLLTFPERDLFMRGIRAFAGFRQYGVDYTRPERMFGRTTNSFFKNIGWAKKGILSFSNVPLNMLSFSGVILFIISVLLMLIQVIMKIVNSNSAPAGVTTILIFVGFFGSINLIGLSLIGEYVAKVFEEVKQRPHFIRRSIVKNGRAIDAYDSSR